MCVLNVQSESAVFGVVLHPGGLAEGALVVLSVSNWR